jgi:hypothetical protein
MEGTLVGLAAPPALSGAKHLSKNLRPGLDDDGASMPAASYLVAYCQKVLPWTAAAFLHVALQPGIENLEFPTH